MHEPTGIFWAYLTPFSLQVAALGNPVEHQEILKRWVDLKQYVHKTQEPLGLVPGLLTQGVRGSEGSCRTPWHLLDDALDSLQIGKVA
jgi:hypothetical protein